MRIHIHKLDLHFVFAALPPTLLVVDDNKELLALLAGLFEEAGYTVAA